MDEYLNIFIDEDKPFFLDKYLNTKTLKRLKNVTQFCGCDYTDLYSPRFKYTRYMHSLVIANMTWHFTHDKKETIVSLFHDAGTPCFAHCIDYVFGDYINQESSEKSIKDVIKEDKHLKELLKLDNISLNDFDDLSNYSILENKSPKLCTDRLDGVLHTCYVWLKTHSLKEIKEVYDNLVVLKNEENIEEIGFKDQDVALKFVDMVFNYAKELQGNKDKYVMKYISEIVKISVEEKLICLDDLYSKTEDEVCEIFKSNFSSWDVFSKANNIQNSNIEPKKHFYISFETKKRNTIPLVKEKDKNKRINEVSNEAEKIYNNLKDFKDFKYAYIDKIEKLN